MSVFIGHSSGSKPSVAASAAADILEAELALGGTPGPTRYYGTNASSVRGFYPLPTGGGGGGGSTNLGITQDASTVTLSSSSGTGVVIPAATITLAGAMTAADRIKLNGISTGATANATDSALRDRSTHTGTQLPSTITGSTTVGQALMTLANPSAVRFARINADNSVELLDATGFRAAIAACVENDARLTTNLGFTRNSEEVFVTSSTGGSATILKATGLLAGVISADSQNKLNNIAAFATANSPDATLLDRANHTGTQSPATITGSTTLGQALMTLANPSAVRYARINADNSVTLLDAAAFLSAIGGGAGGTPAGSDGQLQVNNAGAFGAVSGTSTPGGVITSSAGSALVNPTVALSGQAFSAPIMRWQSSAFAGGVSKTMEWRVVANTIVGTTNPTASLGFELSINGGGWTRGFTIQGGENGSLVSSTNKGTFGQVEAVASLFAENVSFIVSSAQEGACLRSSWMYSWASGTSGSGTRDLFLGRRAAANLRLGAADAASAVAQTLSVQSVVAATSNMGAPVFSIDGSQCTGTAVNGTGSAGDVRIRTAPAGASGSAQNGFVESLRVRAGRGIALSNGNIAAAGDCIGKVTVLRGNTSGTTPAILSESALGGGLPIPLNAVIQAIVLVQGISDAGDVARFARQVCAKNVAGTSSLVSSNVTIGADDSGTTSLAITVSDTNDTLDIQVTGTSGNNWRWNAVILAGELVRYIAG